MTAPDVEIPSHPARWSEPLLPIISHLFAAHGVNEQSSILDPFAGVGLGRLAEATRPNADWYGVEIEPEWARSDPRVRCCSVLDMPWSEPVFDCLISSPCYGNRLSDHHEAKDDSTRITYRHKLGRPLSDGSAGALNWSKAYRDFHAQAWAACLMVLRSHALVIINISNHVRGGQEQRVVEWHMNAWLHLGATIEEVVKVPTSRMGYGANGQARVDGERLLVFRAPDKAGML